MTVMLTPCSLTTAADVPFCGDVASDLPADPNVLTGAPRWGASGFVAAIGVSFPADSPLPEVRMTDDDDADDDDGDDGDDDGFDEDGIELDDDTLAPTELEEFDEEDFDDEFDDDFEEEPEDEFGNEFGEPDSIGDLAIPDGDALDEELSDGVDPIEPEVDLKSVVEVDAEEEEDEEDEEEDVVE